MLLDLLVFTSQFFPKPYCRLSTRRASPSPSPLLSWGACGDSASTSGVVDSELCAFPFFTALQRHSPSPICLTLGIWSKEGANCLKAGGICNAITFWMSRPSVEPKILTCVYTSPSEGLCLGGKSYFSLCTRPQSLSAETVREVLVFCSRRRKYKAEVCEFFCG